MEHSNIVRKIRLSKLDCYTIKPNEKKLFDFIETNLMGLKAVELKEYPDYIMYFNSKNKNIFQYGIYNEYLYCNHDLVWNIFENEFNYDSIQTRSLIVDIMKNAYNIDVIPIYKLINTDKEVEKTYKLNKNNIHKMNISY